MSSKSFVSTSANPTEVFAVHGADPEVLAFAMAKYSRSALSMRESLGEISSQRAEQFLNTFYFQYGHRSIADLAHIAFAIERLSLMAALVLVDEQRWDGQERSTRYQNFKSSSWYFPDFGEDTNSAELYSQTIGNLTATYQRTSAAVLEVLRARIPRPEAMQPDAYQRTLRARAFDCARYLLPLATNTSLGQIVSARTLETQVSRLLSHPAAEIRDLGACLRDAATGPAWNVNADAAKAFVEKLAAFEKQGSGGRDQESGVRDQETGVRDQETGIRDQGSGEFSAPALKGHDPTGESGAPALKGHDFSRADQAMKNEGALAPEANVLAPEANVKGTGFSPYVNPANPEGALAPEGSLAAEAARLFTREVRTAPTLVKYAQPNPYEIETRCELAEAAAQILAHLPIAPAPRVDLVERTESLEVELAATLLYSASHHSYRAIRDLLSGLPAAQIDEIVDLGIRHRGRHDELLRAFHAGAALRFDLLIDIGAFRDLHRHRRCTQIIQGFTSIHGYDTPGAADLPDGTDILADAGVLADFCSAVESAHAASRQIAAGSAPEAAQSALYLLPLATRVRSLFKMDFAEAQYIAELRSAPAGHFSYRRIAWEMFLAFERQHPSLARHIRVTDFTKPIDILQR